MLQNLQCCKILNGKKLEMKKTEKENFVKKFFPSCTSSPGGTKRLVTNPTDVTSAGNRRVGKVSACLSEDHSANNFNFSNIKNSFTRAQLCMQETK